MRGVDALGAEHERRAGGSAAPWAARKPRGRLGGQGEQQRLGRRRARRGRRSASSARRQRHARQARGRAGALGAAIAASRPQSVTARPAARLRHGERRAEGAGARRPPITPWPPCAPTPSIGAAPASSGQRGRADRVEVVGPAHRQPLGRRPGDHRAVVGAERQRRRDDSARRPRPRPRRAPRGSRRSRRRRPRRRRPARRRVAGGEGAERAAGLFGQRLGHGGLEAGAEVGAVARASGRPALGTQPVAGAAHGGLEARRRTGRSRRGRAAGAAGRSGAGRPRAASASTAGPPGWPRPSSFATLSKASPGRVVDGAAEAAEAVRAPRRARNWQWPPETSSIR